MNNRKERKPLSRQEVNDILDGWHRARTIGLPLNAFITVRPDDIDGMTSEAACLEWARIRNLYGEYARRHGFRAAMLWTREIAPDNTGEHIHLLCHVPKRLLASFLALVSGWRSLPGEIDARKADYRQYRARDGKWHSVAHYIVKQMTPQACWRRSLRRQKGGTVFGKRWGCSGILKPPQRPITTAFHSGAPKQRPSPQSDPCFVAGTAG